MQYMMNMMNLHFWLRFYSAYTNDNSYLLQILMQVYRRRVIPKFVILKFGLHFKKYTF